MHLTRVSRKKAMALLLCACVAALFVLSASYIASHAEHDCIGPECVTCARLVCCTAALKKLGMGLCALPLMALALTITRLCARIAAHRPNIPQNTPVALKVRLDN